MAHVSGSKWISVFICSFFVVQAAAQNVDDNTEKLKMFQAAVAQSAFCQALPFDVSKSIILNDGNPVLSNPALLTQFTNDVNMKTLMQNCISSVTNSNETVAKKDQVNPSLLAKLRNAAVKFVMGVSVLANKNQNSTIDPVIATIGIRG